MCLSFFLSIISKEQLSSQNGKKTKQLRKWTISCNKRDKALKKSNIKSPVMIWLNVGVSIWGKMT